MMDRGENEVIGFVLVFAIITVSIGIIYAIGFTGINDAKEAEKLENVERAFDVLHDNTLDLYHRKAPSRATEIKLAGGSIEFLEETQMTLQTNGTGCSPSCPRYNNTTRLPTVRPLAYTEGDTQIVYSSGATFRTDDGGDAMLLPPAWVATRRQTVIPTIVTYPGEGPNSLSGQTTMLVIAQRRGSNVYFHKRAGGPAESIRVNLSIQSERAGAWRHYLEEQGYTVTEYDPGNDVLYVEFETDEVYVPKTEIELQLSP